MFNSHAAVLAGAVKPNGSTGRPTGGRAGDCCVHVRRPVPIQSMALSLHPLVDRKCRTNIWWVVWFDGGTGEMAAFGAVGRVSWDADKPKESVQCATDFLLHCRATSSPCPSCFQSCCHGTLLLGGHRLIFEHVLLSSFASTLLVVFVSLFISTSLAMTERFFGFLVFCCIQELTSRGQLLFCRHEQLH